MTENGKSVWKLNDLRPLQDRQLDHVSGGFTPRDPNDDRDYSKNLLQPPPSPGRRF